MSQHHPNDTDAILGVQNSTPINAAVLGGLARAKQYLPSKWISIRLLALNDAINYGEDGINLVIQSLTDDAEDVRVSAYKLLCSQISHDSLRNQLEEPYKNEFLRILAGDPDAPCQLLIDLLGSTDLLILRNLASNKNTPTQILNVLGDIGKIDDILSRNIHEFATLNKVVNFNPFCYREKNRVFRHNGKVNLNEHYYRLAQQGISDEIIEIVKSGCEIYKNVVKNPSTSTSIALTIGDFLTDDFIQNPIWYQHAISNPLIIQQSCSLDMQIKIAENSNTSVEGLMCLQNNCHRDVYKYIARNHNTSVEVLENIVAISIEHPIYPKNYPIYMDETPIAIAENHKTPAHILEILAKYRNKITDKSLRSALRIAISQNANTSSQVLEYLNTP